FSRDDAQDFLLRAIQLELEHGVGQRLGHGRFNFDRLAFGHSKVAECYAQSARRTSSGAHDRVAAPTPGQSVLAPARAVHARDGTARAGAGTLWPGVVVAKLPAGTRD